jgi:beta-lactamase class A
MKHFNWLAGLAFFGFTAMWISCSTGSSAKKATLQSDLEKITGTFHGTAGIYVYCPNQKLEISIHADTLFPSASMIKVPILCTLWEEVASGDLEPDSIIRFYPDSLHYPWKGEDALGRFAPGEDISVRHLMTHMITFSDNHASICLQEMAGTGTRINDWLQRNGFSNTRVNSRTEGRSKDYERFGWGQTTPREMASLLMMIRQGRVVTPAISEAIYRHLTRIYWNGEALSQIPPTVQAASKQGAVDRSCSEVVLVNAPRGDYVFCVITKNQQDTNWSRSNEGYRFIRTVSALLWKYFEPGFPYKAPEDLGKYLP